MKLRYVMNYALFYWASMWDYKKDEYETRGEARWGLRSSKNEEKWHY